MGVRTLNSFLKQKCKDSIKTLGLKNLSNKKIVVDTSIYLYRFESSDTLIESFYLMLIVFKKYNITPIFIFDGKIPEIKKEMLKKRKKEKIEAITKYNELKDIVENNGYSKELNKKLDAFRKKMVTMNTDKINKVKLLFTLFGACFLEAEGEADLLCVEFVRQNKVYACLSEDMDMFAYNCPRILRYLSLINHNCILYDLDLIQKSLKISNTDMTDLCILSGTDYNINEIDEDKNFHFWYEKYLLYKEQNLKLNFIEWVINNDYKIDKERICKIQDIFINSINLSDLNCDEITNGIMMKKDLQNLLEEDGFIFQ